MPDPFGFARPGQVRDRSANRENLFVEAARAQRNRRYDQTSPNTPTGRNADIVPVLNETGRDLDRYAVVGLGEPIFTPSQSEEAFLREVTFRGVVPAEFVHRARFAVLLEPAADGRVARAYVAGACQVRVFVSDESHGFADIEDGETGRLVSQYGGGAQILWRDGLDESVYGYDGGYEDTEQWAIVRLGPDVGGSRLARSGSGGIPGKSGAVVTLYDVRLNGVKILGAEAFAYNDGEGDVDGSTDIQLKVVQGVFVVDWEECDTIY